MRKKHLVKSKRNNRSRKSKKTHSRKYRGGGKPEIRFFDTEEMKYEDEVDIKNLYNSATKYPELNFITYGDMIAPFKHGGIESVTHYPDAYSELIKNRYVTNNGILDQKVVVASGGESKTYVDNRTGVHLVTTTPAMSIGDLMESIWFIYGPNGMRPDMISPPILKNLSEFTNIAEEFQKKELMETEARKAREVEEEAMRRANLATEFKIMKQREDARNNEARRTIW